MKHKFSILVSGLLKDTLDYSVSKHIIKGLSILMVILYQQSCIEPYKFETPDGSNRLVVDGFITTENKVHEILISKSTGYYADKQFDPLHGALVKIVSDQGEVFLLSENAPGKYVTEPLAAQVGRSYKLTIDTFDGKMYESGFETVIAVNPFEDIHYEYRNDEFSSSGISVFAINTEPSGVPTYLMWDYTGHQLVYRVYGDPQDTAAGEILYTCVSTEYCNNCLNISSDKFYSGNTYNQFIGRIPYTSQSKYVMKIDKYAISPNVYEYFSQINRIANNSGTIFDSPPTLVRGNLINIHDENEIVHGYFYASDKFSKIFTIRRDNFSVPPERTPPINVKPCIKNPVACALSPLKLPDPPPCENEPPYYWD